MFTWKIHDACRKGTRLEFRPGDVFHRDDGKVAAQIIEADVIRIKYERFCVSDGKYLSEGEFDTSAELFVKMLTEG
jgi:hypothetical protein